MLNDAAQGYPARPVVCAHIPFLVEPLLFAPAFLAVGWVLLRRRRPPPEEEHP